MKAEKSDLIIKGLKIGGIVICVAFTVVLGMWVNISAYRFNKARVKFNAGKSKLSRLRKDKERLMKTLQHYRTEREKFQRILFTDKDIASFLDKISQLAVQSNVKIVNMRTKKFKKVEPVEEMEGVLAPLAKKKISRKRKKKDEEKGPVLSSLAIDMKISGNFDSLVNFLIFLERSRQLLTLSNIEVKVSSYPTLTASFVLRLYSLKDISGVKKRRR